MADHVHMMVAIPLKISVWNPKRICSHATVTRIYEDIRHFQKKVSGDKNIVTLKSGQLLSNDTKVSTFIKAEKPDLSGFFIFM